MTQVGRPPKPNEQKRRLGDPGRHGLPAADEVAPLAPMSAAVPPSLGPAGAELWEAVHAAATPWLAPSDSLVLLMLCEQYDRRAMYLDALAQHGALITRPDGHLVANPAAQLVIQTEKSITDIAASLGLTPADRTRMGLAEVKKIRDEFEDIFS